MLRRPPPERRRRSDVVVAVVLVAVLAGVAVLLGRTSEVAATTSSPAEVPIAAPPAAPARPGGFTEAWRAPNGASPVPVVAGPAVVTGDGGTVVGHDARTGEARWTYSRDLALCAVGAGFPTIQQGRVLALYLDPDSDTGDGPYCSEMTALDGDTGRRFSARNPDSRPGTRLLADAAYVLSTNTDHLELIRFDLVRTLEYGDVPAQEEVGRQPRPDCTYGSEALGGRRLAVIERCPGEPTDRLTVLSSDGVDGAERPEVKFTQLLPGTGAVVVATTADRVAVALPDPARLVVFDGAGAQVGTTQLDLPASDLAADPPGGVAATSTDGERLYWWTGSVTVALDATELAPIWTAPGTLGPPVAYGDDLLSPVPDGLAVVDPVRGTGGDTDGTLLPVDRADPRAPVALATQGEVLLEQRGTELVALLPTR